MVHGRVQGVGFRLFVESQARALGLTGFVRNLGDPRIVEVLAEGTRDQLDALLAQLHIGPRSSRVERVDVSWIQPSGTFRGFETR